MASGAWSLDYKLDTWPESRAPKVELGEPKARHVTQVQASWPPIPLGMEPRTPRSTNSLLGLSSIRIAELPQSLMGGWRDLRPLTLDPAHGNTAQVEPNLRKPCWKPVRPGAANQVSFCGLRTSSPRLSARPTFEVHGFALSRRRSLAALRPEP